MTILKEVLAELVTMFVADARLSAAILALAGLAALLIAWSGNALFGGVLLLLGCLALLMGSVWLAARRQRSR